MKKQVVSLLTAGMVAASAVAANAFSIEGTIFGDYTSAASSYKIQATLDGLNGFHYTRAYLTLKDKVNDQVSVRLTLDQKDLGAVGANNAAVFVKYAYADIKLADFATLRAGQGHTPWIDFEESLWNHRFVSSTFSDRNGAQSSSDLGVSVNGKFDQLGYMVGMYNGEGYQKTPNGAGTALGARLDYKIGNFGIAGFHWTETHRNTTVNYDPTRTIGMLYYKEDMFTIAGQYLSANDGLAATTFKNGTGYSVWAHTSFPGMEAVRLMARYDSLKAKDTSTVDTTTAMYGVSYKLARTTQVGIFGESVSNAGAVAGQSDSKFSVNMVTGF